MNEEVFQCFQLFSYWHLWINTFFRFNRKFQENFLEIFRNIFFRKSYITSAKLLSWHVFVNDDRVMLLSLFSFQLCPSQLCLLFHHHVPLTMSLPFVLSHHVLPVISFWISLSPCIAANHSDFGGILPLFTQYSVIPIGMTKFRQNLEKSVMLIPWTKATRCFVSSIMLLPAYTYL